MMEEVTRSIPEPVEEQVEEQVEGLGVIDFTNPEDVKRFHDNKIRNQQKE